VTTLLLMAAEICIGAIAFTLIGIAAARSLVSRGVGSGHNDVSSAIFTVGGTIYAVFLAFLVVVVWEGHDAAKANAAEEASLLCTLYRGSTAMEQESGDQLRGIIRQYTRAVIIDEWPVQARNGGASEKARAAGLGMFQVFAAHPLAAQPRDVAIEQMQLSLIAQVQADRNKRTLQAQETISSVIWLTAIVNGVLVVVMSFFLYPDRDWPHLVMSSMLAVMISMFLYVIYIFGQPFRGPVPLGPDAFAHSLEVYDSVDRLPTSPQFARNEAK